MRQVQTAVSLLHGAQPKSFVHGDIREPNIVLNYSPADGTRAYIIDFGRSGSQRAVQYPEINPDIDCHPPLPRVHRAGIRAQLFQGARRLCERVTPSWP